MMSKRKVRQKKTTKRVRPVRKAAPNTAAPDVVATETPDSPRKTRVQTQKSRSDIDWRSSRDGRRYRSAQLGSGRQTRTT